MDKIYRTMTYISATRQDIEDEEIIDLVKQTGGDTMETIVDRLEKRGERRGVHRGRMEGRMEGIEIGERRGRSEGRLEIANKMKRDGFPVEIIMKYTDLSEEEIRAL